MNRLYRTSRQGVAAPRFALNPLNLGLGLLLSSAVPSAWAAATELPAVTVTGDDTSGYQADSASVGGFEAASLLDTPASISVVNEAMIKEIGRAHV